MQGLESPKAAVLQLSAAYFPIVHVFAFCAISSAQRSLAIALSTNWFTSLVMLADSPASSRVGRHYRSCDCDPWRKSQFAFIKLSQLKPGLQYIPNTKFILGFRADNTINSFPWWPRWKKTNSRVIKAGLSFTKLSTALHIWNCIMEVLDDQKMSEATGKWSRWI